ncbi:MAG: sigma-70 family RNA polymerase sigma factor [Bryobacterales bacterium]|nr:sigma-70 family RNA polymerase sigma factor [Bryobacterales bacterium]
MDQAPITELLHAWKAGDRTAGDRLIELTYQELRRMASNAWRREASGGTLEPTALVHELYLRLFSQANVDYQDRVHFFAVAARQLRRLLIGAARARKAEKRQGERVRVTLLDADQGVPAAEMELLDLEQALEELEALDERCARVVELRYLAGLTEPEAAEVLGVSPATAKRDWQFARSWLMARLSGTGPATN